jgi:hypothetical protein
LFNEVTIIVRDESINPYTETPRGIRDPINVPLQMLGKKNVVPSMSVEEDDKYSCNFLLTMLFFYKFILRFSDGKSL